MVLNNIVSFIDELRKNITQKNTEGFKIKKKKKLGKSFKKVGTKLKKGQLGKAGQQLGKGLGKVASTAAAAYVHAQGTSLAALNNPQLIFTKSGRQKLQNRGRRDRRKAFMNSKSSDNRQLAEATLYRAEGFTSKREGFAGSFGSYVSDTELKTMYKNIGKNITLSQGKFKKLHEKRDTLYADMENAYYVKNYLEEAFKECYGGLDNISSPIDENTTLNVDSIVSVKNSPFGGDMKCGDLSAYYKYVTSMSDPNAPSDDSAEQTKVMAYRNKDTKIARALSHNIISIACRGSETSEFKLFCSAASHNKYYLK